MAKTKADIRSLARVHTNSAINTLKGIMNEPKAPAAARVTAAVALLDRGWGKPKETVEHTGDAFASLWGAIQGTSQATSLTASSDDDYGSTTH